MFDGNKAPGDEVFTLWGEELPPVGTKCSVDFFTCVVEVDLMYSLINIFKDKTVEVVAHDEVFGFKVAVFRTKVNGANMYVYHSLSAECFSPAKTQRERDIEALVDAITSKGEMQPTPIVRERWRNQATFAYDFIVKRLREHGGDS